MTQYESINKGLFELECCVSDRILGSTPACVRAESWDRVRRNVWQRSMLFRDFVGDHLWEQINA